MLLCRRDWIGSRKGVAIMRLQFTFVVCILTVASLAGCSSSSGSRTAYRTSSSGAGPSYGSSHQYDADPPSTPSVANSPLPARQTSSRETPVQGISFGAQSTAATAQPTPSSIQTVGYRRSIFGKFCRPSDPCCQECLCHGWRLHDFFSLSKSIFDLHGLDSKSSRSRCGRTLLRTP